MRGLLVAAALAAALAACAPVHHPPALGPGEVSCSVPIACSAPRFVAQRVGGRVSVGIYFSCPEESP